MEKDLDRLIDPKTLTITADCGGANSNRVRRWKTECQRLADSTGLEIQVCHFPPGTSKWNKIEHRLFSFMSINWRGKPLESHEIIISLIAATTTTGLKVYAQLDKRPYPTKTQVSPTSSSRRQPDANRLRRNNNKPYTRTNKALLVS